MTLMKSMAGPRRISFREMKVLHSPVKGERLVNKPFSVQQSNMDVSVGVDVDVGVDGPSQLQCRGHDMG